ncbi:hypothetical protein ADUPG1_001345, partial [Aduncisulcus paluster]
NEKESPFVVGCYVWLKPHKKVSKLSEKVRGPFKVVDVGPHYMVEIEDILTDSRCKVHTDRLFIVKGKHSIEELKETAASSQGEYIIEFIVDHRGETEEEIEFRVRGRGYDAEEDTWECLQTVDDSIALDDYLKDHPSLKSVVKEK